jgi:two-component system KDP operon response regulator KdpE
LNQEHSALALVVDDEPQIRRAIHNALVQDGLRVMEAGTAAEGIDLAAAHRPQLIILDLALPDRPGVEVCREIRKWSSAPIIVLSARHGETEKVTLLDAGADDYVTKPFSPAELRARAKAQLRRAQQLATPAGEGPVLINGLRIDIGARRIDRNGEEIHLTPTEWELLRVLVRHAGRTLTHARLFSSVWARSGGDPQQYLRVYVAQLRRKIEQDPVRPRLIITEPGVGYRFADLG